MTRVTVSPIIRPSWRPRIHAWLSGHMSGTEHADGDVFLVSRRSGKLVLTFTGLTVTYTRPSHCPFPAWVPWTRSTPSFIGYGFWAPGTGLPGTGRWRRPPTRRPSAATDGQLELHGEPLAVVLLDSTVIVGRLTQLRRGRLRRRRLAGSAPCGRGGSCCFVALTPRNLVDRSVHVPAHGPCVRTAGEPTAANATKAATTPTSASDITNRMPAQRSTFRLISLALREVSFEVAVQRSVPALCPVRAVALAVPQARQDGQPPLTWQPLTPFQMRFLVSCFTHGDVARSPGLRSRCPDTECRSSGR